MLIDPVWIVDVANPPQKQKLVETQGSTLAGGFLLKFRNNSQWIQVPPGEDVSLFVKVVIGWERRSGSQAKDGTRTTFHIPVRGP